MRDKRAYKPEDECQLPFKWHDKRTIKAFWRRDRKGFTHYECAGCDAKAEYKHGLQHMARCWVVQMRRPANRLSNKERQQQFDAQHRPGMFVPILKQSCPRKPVL